MSDNGCFKVPSIPLVRVKGKADDERIELEQQVLPEASTVSSTPAPAGEGENETESKSVSEGSSGDDEEQQLVSLSYVEPHWSGTPSDPYTLLIVKNGTEIGKLVLDDKPYHTFGRLPSCDVSLEHPSISRYHAILQYRPDVSADSGSNDGTPEAGFYVYDLASTHGTYLNKRRVRPRAYCRLRIGQMIRFGGSTRLFILEAGRLGQEAVEEAAEREIAALSKHQEEMRKQEQEFLKLEKQRQALEKEREELGATWGMVDDEIDIRVGKADEIDLEREAYYRDDPRKALRKYFDQEDLELEYETVETGKRGVHCIRVSLPVQSVGGEMVVAEATVKGKRREAVVQCSLEACRLLDSYGMLRQASQSRKRKDKNWEDDDFYSSDEDSFLDRTGIIERKRHNRMKKVGKAEDTMETHETLNDKLVEVNEKVQALEARLAKAKRAEAAGNKGDSLDVYMKSVKEKLDKGTMYDIKLQLNKLKKEETRLCDLVKLTQPTALPVLKQLESEDTLAITKKNPNKKQYGLTRLPVDRKQAYLMTHADQSSEQCEVEYDSDDDNSNSSKVDISKIHPTIATNGTKLVSTVRTVDEDVNEQTKELVSDDMVVRPAMEQIKDLAAEDARVTGQQNASEDDGGKELSSPKKKKIIGPSLGPLRKRRRRSSEANSDDVNAAAQWTSDYDPDYASWLPPEDQSGDGKTYLNAKYGY